MTVIPIRRPTGDHLNEVASLANTDSRRPEVQARQQRSEELTRFQIEHDPTYATELARLRSWVGSYEIPTPEEDA